MQRSLLLLAVLLVCALLSACAEREEELPPANAQSLSGPIRAIEKLPDFQAITEIDKELLAKKKREIKQQELEKERVLDLYQTGQVGLQEIALRLKSCAPRSPSSTMNARELKKTPKRSIIAYN